MARHLKLNWDIIKSIQKPYLEKQYSKPKLSELQRIENDEICIGKRRYLTVVMDILSGSVVFIGDGKGGGALDPFWERLRRSRKAKIEAVAIDMSPAYIKAVRDNLKDAVIVFDHFHVIKMFNEKLSDFRRQLHNNTINNGEKKLLKGTR